MVLARNLMAAGSPQAVPAALRRYEAMRMDRTSRIQIGSRGNNWLRDGGNADWVYGYDAWQVSLGGARAAGGMRMDRRALLLALAAAPLAGCTGLRKAAAPATAPPGPKARAWCCWAPWPARCCIRRGP